MLYSYLYQNLGLEEELAKLEIAIKNRRKFLRIIRLFNQEAEKQSWKTCFTHKEFFFRMVENTNKLVYQGCYSPIKGAIIARNRIRNERFFWFLNVSGDEWKTTILIKKIERRKRKYEYIQICKKKKN
jgi:hypothetical protein